MTASDKLHGLLRARDDHRKRCASRTGGACDCYASNDTMAHALIDGIEAINADLLAACKPVIAAVNETRDGTCLDDDRETWNPNAHVEITLSVAEVWAIQDALDKAK